MEVRACNDAERHLAEDGNGGCYKSGRVFKASTRVGVDSFHPKVPLHFLDWVCEKMVVDLHKMEKTVVWVGTASKVRHISKAEDGGPALLGLVTLPSQPCSHSACGSEKLLPDLYFQLL